MIFRGNATPVTPDADSLLFQVNVSDLGIVTAGGKVAWGRYAQITNSPEMDGCVNGVLLV